jgi:MFS transporter, SET family, sugar efflux transporter
MSATMSSRALSLYPFLLVLFIGTTCSSMIGPFMAYYIVEGLGRAPWTISFYAGGVTVLGIICTRTFAELGSKCHKVDFWRKMQPLMDN